MRLIYLDEAGNTGAKADPDQPIHMIGTLIAEQSQVRPLEMRLNELAVACAALISSRKGLDELAVRAEDIEFHGTHLYGGNGSFKLLKPAERVSFCTEIIGACATQGIVFGSCLVDKMKLMSGHPHMLCFKFTLERVQDYLERVGDLGLIIADEHRELEEQIILDLAYSKYASTQWGYRPTVISRIIDTVHFVKSRHNRIIQACDILTYFRLKGERLRERLLSTFAQVRQSRPTLSWPDHLEASTSQNERAVLLLLDQIKQMERFTKRWPVS